jgi:nucleotide-binding universal stress UspA family protein
MAVRVPSSVHCEFRITEAGFVHDEIVAQIAATQADVLVLGTHGRSGFQRLFLGSVTEKVIRKATCPVLVVPPRAPDVAPEAPVQFKRILCAVDFSASSLSALEQALTLSQEADAQLHLLHVIETPTELREGPWVAATLLEEFRERAVVDAQRRLLDLVPEQARTFCTVDTRVTEGRAYKQVLEQALAQEADLIVMGARGRDALDRLVFGSTTHYVIRAAACPVLVIRTP